MDRKENWKPIKNYEGLYEVSDLGNVRRVERKEHLLKPATDKYGYDKLSLSKNNIKENKTVHRLVAEAFIPNPDNYSSINHIDENKTNNCASNLEWCTVKYNDNYGTRNERCKVKISKPVLQYTMDGQLVSEYISAREADRITGIQYSEISGCCNNKYGRRTAGGFIWKFKD